MMTKIMGIVNVTTDSFSGDGAAPTQAILQAQRFIEMGVDIVDVGGESTRPGAVSVSEAEEISRVVPVIQAIRQFSGQIPISIDTIKARTAEQAIKAGATMINDVSGLLNNQTITVAAREHVPLILTHSAFDALRQQADHSLSEAGEGMKPERDIVAHVVAGLKDLAAAAVAQGVAPEHIILDPGIGFGKKTSENIKLIKSLPAMQAQLPYPLLIGASRKRFIGDITGAPVTNRLGGSLAVATVALLHHVAILRVHDVIETIQARAIVKTLTA